MEIMNQVLFQPLQAFFQAHQVSSPRLRFQVLFHRFRFQVIFHRFQVLIQPRQVISLHSNRALLLPRPPPHLLYSLAQCRQLIRLSFLPSTVRQVLRLTQPQVQLIHQVLHFHQMHHLMHQVSHCHQVFRRRCILLFFQQQGQLTFRPQDFLQKRQLHQSLPKFPRHLLAYVRITLPSSLPFLPPRLQRRDPANFQHILIQQFSPLVNVHHLAQPSSPPQIQQTNLLQHQQHYYHLLSQRTCLLKVLQLPIHRSVPLAPPLYRQVTVQVHIVLLHAPPHMDPVKFPQSSFQQVSQHASRP